MAQILVRDLEEAVVVRLKERARKRGRSLQSEVRMILEQAADEAQLEKELAFRLAADFRKRFRGRKFSDRSDLVREDRDH